MSGILNESLTSNRLIFNHISSIILQLSACLSQKMDGRLLAAGLITILSLVAVAIYWVVPCLPE
jgi:hypothetical protein